MLKLTVKTSESFNEETNEFVWEEIVIELEHSLVSLSKWEIKYEKPFLGPDKRTPEEIMGYVEAMILTPDYPENLMELLTKENLEEINNYIDAKMTATWFTESKNAPRAREVITNELIYYWITSYQIPWETQYWHLNRLFTLIKVFNAKQEKPKNVPKKEALEQRRTLNEQRKAQMNTKG